MKRLRSLTLWLGGSAVVLAALAVGSNRWPVTRDYIAEPDQILAAIQAFVSNEDDSEPLDEAERRNQIREGNSILKQSRLLLLHRSAPLTADVLQIIQTPDETFRGTGKYWQAADGKSRLLIEMTVGESSGRMLQVSNGNVLWSIREIMTGDQPEQDAGNRRLRIERIDVQRLTDSLVESQLAPTDAIFARDTTGGLAGLLAALEAQMDFRVVRHVSLQEQTCLVLEGTWKPTDEQSSEDRKLFEKSLAPSRPDLVRLFLRESDLLPLRYLCLKEHPHESRHYAQLAMELSQISEKVNFDPRLFDYRPPEDQVPDDVTHVYLSRLERIGKDSDAKIIK